MTEEKKPDGGAATDASLRQWYAGMALQGLLASGDSGSIQKNAEIAFKQADAMIEQGEKK